MKTKLPKLLIAIAILGVSSLPTLQAQTTAVTTPVGYHTLTVKSSGAGPLFNYLGTNFVKKTLAAGAITGEAANTVTDSNADFVTAFAGATNLFVEITTGANAGANTTVASFTATSLTTDDDLSTLSDPNDTYVVRESQTVADVFGAANEGGLAGADAGVTADVIWVSAGVGAWDQYFYNLVDNAGFGITPGWKKVGGGDTDHGDTPLYFTDGIFVERKTTPDLAIVVSGHVRTKAAVIPIFTGFNYLDRVFPVGETLANSKIYDDTAPGGTIDPEGTGPAGNDLVWMQKADKSGWDTYFYNTTNNPTFGITPGWKKVGQGDVDYASEPLREGIIIQRKPGSFNLVLAPAALYDNL